MTTNNKRLGAKRPSYTEDQKIACVGILLQNSKGEGAMSYAAVAMVRAYLGTNVSTDTLHKWLKMYRAQVEQAIANPVAHPAIATVVNDVQDNVVESMEHIRNRLTQEIGHYLDTHHGVIDDKNIARFLTAFGIIQDKIDLALKNSAATMAIIRPLAIWCSERGLDMSAVIDATLATLQRMNDEQLDKYKVGGRLGDGS